MEDTRGPAAGAARPAPVPLRLVRGRARRSGCGSPTAPSATTSTGCADSATRSTPSAGRAVATGSGSARSCRRCCSTTTRPSRWRSGCAPATGISGIEETSARALAKLEQVLPHRLQRQVNAVARCRERRARTTPAPTSRTRIVDAGAPLRGGRRDPRPRGAAVRLPGCPRGQPAPARAVPAGQLAAAVVSWSPATRGPTPGRRTGWTGCTLRTPGGRRFTPQPLPGEDYTSFVLREVGVLRLAHPHPHRGRRPGRGGARPDQPDRRRGRERWTTTTACW